MISFRTMDIFREWISGWTLEEIQSLFSSFGFQRVSISGQWTPKEQVQSAVSQYLDQISLRSPGHIVGVLKLFKEMIDGVYDENPYRDNIFRGRLVESLLKDGFRIEKYSIRLDR